MQQKTYGSFIILLSLLLVSCPHLVTPDKIIYLFEVPGITAPVYGVAPVTANIDTEQYSGTVAWSPKTSLFAESTVYSANIELTAKEGWTFEGIPANSFTVTGAVSRNEAGSGSVVAVFTATEDPSTITSLAIPGLVVPVAGNAPVNSAIDTLQYSGTLIWSPSDNPFKSLTEYTAHIELTAKTGWTLAGVAANSFTVAGASSTNAADSGSVAAVFPAKDSWTLMYYGDADNDLEAYLLMDVAEMKDGLQTDTNINVIVLFDRIAGDSGNSDVFGEDFNDTRLYRIISGGVQRLGGASQMPDITTKSTYEANMGDVATLASFIDFCKANYPAYHYALILSDHGGGARSLSVEDVLPKSITPAIPESVHKAICWDDTSGGDALYTAEFTDGLTSAHSVDLLVFDACLMGTAEVAYQYRPGTGDFSADWLAASAPTVWGFGLPYDAILERIIGGGEGNGTTDTTVGGNEVYVDAITMTPRQLGGLIVEEQFDSTTNQSGESFSLFDLSRAASVKSAVDALAVALASDNEMQDTETIRGSLDSPGTMYYFDAISESEWINNPYFDLYSLAVRISTSASFSAPVKSFAATVATEVDTMTVYSFGGPEYTTQGFTTNRNGLSIFFTDGNRLVAITDQYQNQYQYPSWAFEWWYSPIDTNIWWPGGHYYGKLAWCIDGRTDADSRVQNWFELLDEWFDNPTDDWNGVTY